MDRPGTLNAWKWRGYALSLERRLADAENLTRELVDALGHIADRIPEGSINEVAGNIARAAVNLYHCAVLVQPAEGEDDQGSEPEGESTGRSGREGASGSPSGGDSGGTHPTGVAASGSEQHTGEGGETVKYRTIVADPPWPYENPGGGKLSASPIHRPNSFDSPKAGPGSRVRYGALAIADLLELVPPSEDDAHLYLWTTNAFMVEAHEIARAWGFKPKTICTWGKVKPDGSASMKTGYYFRGATEHVVFAVKGKLPFPDEYPTATLWLWPRLPHSVKPDAFYDLVEQVSPGPYLELFARRQRLGWDTWGNEALEHVEMTA